MRNPAARLLLLLALVFFATPVAAHPHVWVTYMVKPAANATGINKIYFTWRFDAMFTEMVKEDLGIKTIGEKENILLRDKAFGNLKNYHYYMHIKADGVDFLPTEIGDFEARLAGKQLVYDFSVTLPKPAKEMELSIWDEEFYVDLDPPTEEVADDKKGSAMAEHKYKPKEFISPVAETGGKAPDCNWQARSRDSQIWGTFTTFSVLCKAKP